MKSDSEPEWVARPEETVDLTFRVPCSVAEALAAMATYLDLSEGALLRRYTGVGLRQDQARYFSEQALTTVEDVLRANGADETFVVTVLREARTALKKATNPRFRTARGGGFDGAGSIEQRDEPPAP